MPLQSMGRPETFLPPGEVRAPRRRVDGGFATSTSASSQCERRALPHDTQTRLSRTAISADSARHLAAPRLSGVLAIAIARRLPDVAGVAGAPDSAGDGAGSSWSSVSGAGDASGVCCKASLATGTIGKRRIDGGLDISGRKAQCDRRSLPHCFHALPEDRSLPSEKAPSPGLGSAFGLGKWLPRRSLP